MLRVMPDKILQPLSSVLFFLAMPRSMRDLSSLTRDRTRVPAVEAQSLIHWTAREVPNLSTLNKQTTLAWRKFVPEKN